MSSGGLTEEQKKRIEENRRKAIERRAVLSGLRQQKSTAVNRSEDGGKFTPQNQPGRPTVSGNSAFLPKAQRASLPKQQSALKTGGYLENNNNHTGNFNAIAVGQAKPSSDVSISKEQNSLQGCSSSSSKSSNSQTSFQSAISKFCRPPKSYSPTRKIENSTRISSHETSTRTSLTRTQTLLAPSVGRTGGSAKSSKISALNTLSKLEKSVKGNCVLISKERFAVLVPYHTQLIGIFKTIPSKNYDAKTTNWNFLLVDYDRLMSAVKSLPPHVTVEGLPKAVVSTFLKHTPGTLKDLSVTDINLNSIDGKLVRALMPFQKEGICFSIRRNGRVLIADDMGLGKTVQAICVACYYRIEWPLLVITPSSLRVTWQQAFLKWLPSVEPQDINVILTGKDNPTTGLINVISYDLLSKHLDDIKQKQFRVIIADECHFIKNYKASRTQTALPLLKSATRVILLSGTPALSRPLELYTQICAIQPTLFPTFHQFGIRYCAGQQNYYGWDFSGASNMAELQLLLEEKLMIRRLKKDVLSQLPSKRRQMVLMDPSLIKTKTIERAAKQVSTAKQKEQQGALLNYFFETCAAKIPAVRNYILDLLESGRKFLVFAHHKGMLDAISNCLSQKKFSFIRIDGNTPAASRQGLCDHFQQDKDCLVAVLSITAANTGLTLTEASAVVFAELFWNPGALVQAEDRVYRIGQKNSVNIHYLVAKGTADDYLWPLIQNKLEVLGKAGLSEEELDADCTFFQDPRQHTLFSCVESFIEKSRKDVSENSTELFDSVTSSSKENDSQSVSAKTNKPEKQLEIAAGSDCRKRTLREEGSGNETYPEKGSGNKTFDWFEDLNDEDLLDCDLEDVMADCSKQIRTRSSDVIPPSAKRRR